MSSFRHFARILGWLLILACGLAAWVLGWIWYHYQADLFWMTFCCAVGSFAITALIHDIADYWNLLDSTPKPLRRRAK